MEKINKLDQFYTNNNVSTLCISILEKYKLDNYFLFEPSAGTGSFSSLFHSNSLSIDIDPKKEYIIKQDFLCMDLSFFENKKVFVIGNPPFGKMSNLAISFFNKSAKIAEYIAFIVPKTFKKNSVKNRLDLNFSLIEEIELPLNSFIYNDKPYKVPCVFQIWKRTIEKRKIIIEKKTTDYFYFCKKEDADIAIRRIGGIAGRVIKDFNKYKISSNYFIKMKNKEDIGILDKLYKELNDIAKNSAGNPSLSKAELIKIFETKVLI